VTDSKSQDIVAKHFRCGGTFILHWSLYHKFIAQSGGEKI